MYSISCCSFSSSLISCRCHRAWNGCDAAAEVEKSLVWRALDELMPHFPSKEERPLGLQCPVACQVSCGVNMSISKSQMSIVSCAQFPVEGMAIPRPGPDALTNWHVLDSLGYDVNWRPWLLATPHRSIRNGFVWKSCTPFSRTICHHFPQSNIPNGHELHYILLLLGLPY